MTELEIRRSIVETCRQMNATGINQGTSGNISVRHGNGLLITPSAMPYDQMRPEDIVQLNFDGTWEGQYRPSTEWRFHRDIIKNKPDVNAIVHAHPTYCTILAIQ